MVNEGYANAISFSSYRNDSRIEADAVSVEELSFDEEVLPLQSDMDLNTIINVETTSLTTTEKLNSSQDDGIII